MNEQLDNKLLSDLQRDIDFHLYFKGHVNSKSLSSERGISNSLIKQAFELYLKGNDTSQIVGDEIIQSDDFKPVFEYESRRTLFDLANGLMMPVIEGQSASQAVIHPSQLNLPNIDIIARLSRAIFNGNVVNLIYTSLTSGSSARDFVPHSIIDNGLRWYVRGYDRKSAEFRDLVVTRISKVTIKSNQVTPVETKQNDLSWHKIVELEIIPHPNNVKFSQAIEMDYGMVDGKLKTQVRAAMAGYLLRRWNVDCSQYATLRSAEYQLYLNNRNILIDLQNVALAPGYVG
jgi:hypothetical protein